MASDTEIRDDIVAELDFDQGVEAGYIGVSVKDGVVVLIGTVSDYAQKAAAEAAAKRVSGVRSVVEQLKVDLPYECMRCDHDIASHIANVLDWSVGPAAQGVKVAVDKGWVTLTGALDSHHQRARAERAIGELRGIVGIINLITVRPSTRAIDLSRRISEALQRAAHVDASSIKVEVDGGEVMLSGAVRDMHEKEIAEKTAWAAHGVHHVVDHIQIAP